jgi:hypothetical protein
VVSSVPPEFATLNLKVRSFALESVAVTFQEMGVPRAWGEAAEGVMEVMVTVANAGNVAIMANRPAA